MHAVGHQLLGRLGVQLAGLLERRNHRPVQVGHREVLFAGQLLHELAVAHQHLVITALESRRAGHVIERRIEDLLIERAVAAVVHAQHDGHDGRLVGDHIAGQAHVDRSGPAAGHAIAADTGVYKTNLQLREAGDHIRLNERGVQTLVRDAVAVEDHAVAIVQIEVGGRCCHHVQRAQRQQQAKYRGTP